jgi:hypothetical protein
VKKIAGIILAAAAALVLTAPPSFADHDYDGGGYDDRRGDCRGSEGGCEDNDFSPSFKDSPVDRSFNPVICLPMSTCHTDGSGEGGEQRR